MANNMEPSSLSYQEQSLIPQPNNGKTQILGIDNNVAGLICYLPFGFIAAIIFTMAEPKQNRFVRFHAIQSLLFGGVVVALSMALSILAQITSHIPFIGWAFLLLSIPFSLIIFFGSLVIAIMAIMKAYQYQMWQIPLLGKYAEKYL